MVLSFCKERGKTDPRPRVQVKIKSSLNFPVDAWKCVLGEGGNGEWRVALVSWHRAVLCGGSPFILPSERGMRANLMGTLSPSVVCDTIRRDRDRADGRGKTTASTAAKHLEWIRSDPPVNKYPFISHRTGYSHLNPPQLFSLLYKIIYYIIHTYIKSICNIFMFIYVIYIIHKKKKFMFLFQAYPLGGVTSASP